MIKATALNLGMRRGGIAFAYDQAGHTRARDLALFHRQRSTGHDVYSIGRSIHQGGLANRHLSVEQDDETGTCGCKDVVFKRAVRQREGRFLSYTDANNVFSEMAIVARDPGFLAGDRYNSSVLIAYAEAFESAGMQFHGRGAPNTKADLRV